MLAFDMCQLHSSDAAFENLGTETSKVSVLPFEDPAEPETSRKLIGADEVGRGALAGPAVVVCVSFPPHLLTEAERRRELLEYLGGLDDSKRLSPKRRERLAPEILKIAHVGIGASPPAEIDRIGIVAACRLALGRAYRTIGCPAATLLLDRGLSLPPAPAGQSAVQTRRPAQQIELTRGDSRSLHIAAASVVAKVTRDLWMTRLAERFPGYGLDRHKGYGTAIHREALQRLGPSPIHRRTFLRRLGWSENQSC